MNTAFDSLTHKMQRAALGKTVDLVLSHAEKDPAKTVGQIVDLSKQFYGDSFSEETYTHAKQTLTDPNSERYFLTIPEAAQLVLQAGALAEGGSIYVLDMGEPVKIMDLAKQLIRFYGYEPGVNMEIKIVGLRPGEKLYEELMMDEEQGKMRRTEHNKIFVASPRDIDLAVFYQQLQDLAAAAQHNDEGVVDQLEKMIPTFTPTRKNLKT